MKTKTSIFLVAALIVGSTSVASADAAVDMYAGLTIGAGAQTVFADGHNETKTAQSFGAMFGVDIPLFRIEAEYNYLNESDSHFNVALVNAYFKMPSTVIKPYLGLGVGMTFNGKNDTYKFDYESTTAYQAMFGVTLGVPALPFKFDVEARAMYLPDIYKAVDNIQPDLLQYEGRVKIRYVF